MKVLFFTTIFTIYSALHLYVFFKIKGALTPGIATTGLLILFMISMIAAPFLVRLLEGYGFDSPARFISYIGYSWMGLIFLFFFCSLAFDLYRLAAYSIGLIIHAQPTFLTPSPRFAFSVALLATLAAASFGYFEARSIRTEIVIIKSPKIPPEMGTFTIAQISDVHLGLIVRHKRLQRIVQEVQRENPDMVVSTGDLVDGQLDNLTGLAELLKALKPPHGKFAVTGNHEFYAGLDQALNLTENAGFTMLRGEAYDVAKFITVVGIDDPTGKYFGLPQGIPERDLLSRHPNKNFTLVLKHMPVVDKASLGLFDLQLSGHTHKGQIFPFNLITRLFFPHHTGLITLPRNSRLYVSRGSGTWGPPIRLLSPPEVTIIKLVHEDNT